MLSGAAGRLRQWHRLVAAVGEAAGAGQQRVQSAACLLRASFATLRPEALPESLPPQPGFREDPSRRAASRGARSPASSSASSSDTPRGWRSPARNRRSPPSETKGGPRLRAPAGDRLGSPPVRGLRGADPPAEAAAAAAVALGMASLGGKMSRQRQAVESGAAPPPQHPLVSPTSEPVPLGDLLAQLEERFGGSNDGDADGQLLGAGARRAEVSPQTNQDSRQEPLAGEALGGLPEGTEEMPPVPLSPGPSPSPALAFHDMMQRGLQELDNHREQQEQHEAMYGVPREKQKSLRVGMIGIPNAGKSVLTNTLVGGKISAVSRKINTTQVATLGIKTLSRTQLMFHDLPGVVVSRDQIKQHKHLERVASAWATAAHCDVLLFIVDAYKEVHSPDKAMWKLATDLQRVQQLPGLADWKCPPAILVLTKVDKIPHEKKPKMLEVSDELLGMHPFFDCHYVSGSDADGTDELLDVLLACAKPRPWDFPAGAKTDRTPAMVALEVSREKLFNRLNKELPYQCRIAHVSWQHKQDGSVRIEQQIRVHTDRQRGIVVGKNGEVVGNIGYLACKELEEMWGIRVHLIINVVVVQD